MNNWNWKEAVQSLVYAIALIIAVMFLANAMAGCTTLEQKQQDYLELGSCAARPDKVVVCWSREGEVRKGFEARCCGEGCYVPNCSEASQL